MTQEYYAVGGAEALLAHHGLDSFSALWALKLDAVDAPNTNRGGWSSVYRLELPDVHGVLRGYYLKRQQDHLTRSLRHPLGEPTFAKEFRAIKRYESLGIPALKAVYFGQRIYKGSRQALLLTEALDDYEPLSLLLEKWRSLNRQDRCNLITAAAGLVRTLHRSGNVHKCLYPKHIFLGLNAERGAARLIDLEKTRRAWLARKDYVSDLATLSRKSKEPSRTDRLRFLLEYMQQPRLDVRARVLIKHIQKRIEVKNRR